MEIAPFLDAMNVDVKAFDDNFYKKVCKARLEPVLSTCERAKELNIHLEVTYLVIPRCNDSIGEVSNFCRWVVEKLGSDTPVHFSRFHPDYKMIDVPMTPMKTLLKICKIAKETGILHLYLGNVPSGEYKNTFCPNCGGVCVERFGYSVSLNGIYNGKCVKCGNSINIVTNGHQK